MGIFNKKESTDKKQKITTKSVCQMLTTYGEHYYAWNGKIYESDIVRACIRPKVRAIGKLVGKHIRDDPKGKLEVNPEANIRFLLSDPNPYMTALQMQEKVALQYYLNNNAFILIVRDSNGLPMQLYPIPCVLVESKYVEHGELYLKFQYMNGKTGTFPYSDIIHLRQDCNGSDIFGASPAVALTSLMNVVTTIDQGIIKAIKNSGIIRWLLKFNKSLRPEDVKENVKEFVDNYLSVETESFGAAGVDSKVDAVRVEPKDYVPNAAQTDRTTERIHSFFNTNKKIVQSDYTEEEWVSYYEAEIEPYVIQLNQTYTAKIFTRKQRVAGDYIVFESNNLQCVSVKTRLDFVSMVDRGGMLVNEWRALFNWAPVEGGDVPIRRLDTQVVNLIEKALENMSSENFKEMAGVIENLLKVTGGEKGET